MPEDKPAPSIPPPLAALGGWQDADWFTPAILTDDEVVGFKLPSMPGARKQSFHVVDRSASAATRGSKTKIVPAAAPKRLAGKLAQILDQYGVLRAVACCKSRFLFETAAILFFAEMPLAKLKLRPANKLRKEVIAIGMQGCVVRLDGASATAMFWPIAESDITDFVVAAQPDHQLHRDFAFASEPALPRSAKGAAAPPPNASGVRREKKLLQEVAALRQEVEALRRGNSAKAAMEQLGLDDARLKSMLMLLHPDKHGGSEAANDAAKWLNGLRELLKESAR